MTLYYSLLLLCLTMLVLYHLVKAYKHSYKLSHPQRSFFSLNADCPIVYKKFNFKTTDQKNLSGIDIRPKCNEKGTLIVCHNLGGSKERMLIFVDFLLAAGYRILSFDFRNHGESEDDRGIKFSLEKDVAAFIEKIKDDIGSPVGIIGFSMGSNAAVFAAEKYPFIKAMIIDSGPLILPKNYFSYALNDKRIKNPLIRTFFILLFLYAGGFSKMSRQTLMALRKLDSKPVFFIHGEKDHIIPIQNTEIAMKLLDSPKANLWKVPASRHLTNKFLRSEEYENKVLDFLNEHLQ